MPRQHVIFISDPSSSHPVLATRKCPVSSVYPSVRWLDEQTHSHSKSKENITRRKRTTFNHGGTTFLRNIRSFTFTLKREICSTVTLNENQIPQGETVKYSGVQLDGRLTWRIDIHVFAKRKQLEMKFQQMY
jgi:hypothetical protein